MTDNPYERRAELNTEIARLHGRLADEKLSNDEVSQLDSQRKLKLDEVERLDAEIKQAEIAGARG